MRFTRGLVALCCLAAAGCGGLDDGSPGRVARGPEPGPASPRSAESAAGPSAASTGIAAATSAVSVPAANAAAASGAASSPAPSANGSVPDVAPTSTGEVSVGAAAEAPLVASEPSTAPESEVAGASSSSAAPVAAASPSAASPPADTLDFESLVKRLRNTKAINLLTKVAVKNQSNDLLEEFRAYHTQHGTATLAELRRSYDSLFFRLHSLLQDADPPLARDVDRSRAAIWEILSDPRKFTASHLMSGA